MPTQFIDPFEREIRRTARRNDGFSEDGLSYRGTDDFGALWGQAMQEYDMARGAPQKQYAPLTASDLASGIIQREAPAARAQSITQQIENPVADPIQDPAQLEALRHELFDPLTQRFGSGRQTQTRATPAPRTYKFGNQIVSVDPLTGSTNQIFSTPEKPDNRGDSFEKQIILGKLSNLRKLQGDRFELLKSGRKLEDVDAEIAALEDTGRKLFEPTEPASNLPAIPAARIPRGVIGSEMDNQFQLPPPSGTSSFAPQPAQGGTPTITSKKQFDALPSDASYIGKNGKRYKKP